MNNSSYLSEEEQFKEEINQQEIDRIQDARLREIRWKYWHLKHEAFLDEYNIPDVILEEQYNRIKALEKNELEEYKRARNRE